MPTYSQPGIFNVLDFGMQPGSGTLASANQGFLQDAVDTAIAAGGGTILIPSEAPVDGMPTTTYYIQGPIYVGTSTSPEPVALIFQGTAQGTKSNPTFQVQNDDGTPLDEDLFSIDTAVSGDQHVGGITFQDLNIAYVTGATSGAAIHALSGENIRLFRMVFTDCPQGVWFENVLQASLLECTGLYTANGNTGTMVMIGNDIMNVLAKEIYIAGCVFNSTDRGSNGAQGGTGIEIQAAEHVRIINTRVEGFHEGIIIAPGAPMSGGHNTIKLFFGNVSVYSGYAYGSTDKHAGTGLIIQPQGDQSISNVVFVDCEFEPGDSAVSSDGPGIFIDQGIYGSTIDNIRFVSCHSTRWSGPGIEITSGSNIEILGGLYSRNASGADPSGGSGGISVTGPAVGVRIVGASCVGEYPVINNDKGGPEHTQDVGVYVAGGAANVQVDSCDLTGNSEYAVSVGGTTNVTQTVFIRNCNCGGYTGSPINFGSNLETIQVTNCTGYNDQATAITTTPPGNGVTFSGETYGYYGPVQFTVEGGSVTQIQIDGHNTNLTSGTFTLGPRDTAKLTYSGIPTFVMIGQ